MSEAAQHSATLGPAAAASASRGMRPAMISKVAGWLLVLALLVAWEASARLGLVKSQSWPPFTGVLRAVWDGMLTGELLGVLLSTMLRMLKGFLIGSAIGVVLGLLIATVPLLRRFLSIVIEAVRPLPIPAIVPPLILFLGIDDGLKVTVVALAVAFPVLINTIGGVDNIDGTLLQTARTFRKTRLETMTSIILPSALPTILAGMRISLGLAFVTTIVAEMIAGSAGVGYFIMVTQYGMRPDQMYAAVICLAALGYGLNWAFVSIERRLVGWDQRQDD